MNETIAFFLLIAILLGLSHVLGTAMRRLIAQRDTARAEEARLLRQLRLTALDMRKTALTLHGHAGGLAMAGETGATGIAVIAGQLLSMADDLQDPSGRALTGRAMRQDVLVVGEVIEDVVTATAATLSPGRRQWRIDPDLAGARLVSDARALKEVLARVLADAVQNTRQDDCIDISVNHLRDRLSLVIEDEGAGLATPGGAAAGPESRGISRRMTLARILMQALDGTMTVEALPRIGTRVTLSWPDPPPQASTREPELLTLATT